MSWQAAYKKSVYHLGISIPENEYGCDAGEYWTPLCGGPAYGNYFVYQASYMLDHPKVCKKCLNHPDFPLYLLGSAW